MSDPNPINESGVRSRRTKASTAVAYLGHWMGTLVATHQPLCLL